MSGYLRCYVRGSKACLQLSEQCRFAGFEKKSDCFPESFPSIVEAYLKKVLSVVFDIARSEKTDESRKKFAKKMAVLASAGRLDSWAVPSGLVLVQSSPLRIYCSSLTLSTQEQSCLNSSSTSFFFNGQNSGAKVATAWTWKRFWH